MTRLVIHAGFHKTGTTSVQTLLRENRDLLSEHLAIYLRPDFEELAETCRRYCLNPKPLRLANVGRAAQAFFGTLAADSPRPILMSSEDLSGLMPGRRDLATYAAAPHLMRVICEAARVRFCKPLDLTLFFSTREADSWLRSAWWQHLRGTRMTENLDSYVQSAREAADFDTVLQAVQSTTRGAVVTALPLEESRDLPQGPLTPLLELAGLPDAVRARIEMRPPDNVRPDLGLEPAFLALNRSGLHMKDLAEIKARILKMTATRQRRDNDPD